MDSQCDVGSNNTIQTLVEKPEIKTNRNGRAVINSTIQDFWMLQTNRLMRKGNLVYAEVLKNASTWANSLLRYNGFVDMKYNDVDWTKDHVFGFIQEPKKRRIKGIVEDLLTYYSVEQYLLNNLGRRFWVEHLTFGPHSIPVSLTWHTKIDQIDWIPIDVENIDVNQMLSKLFLLHGFVFNANENINAHASDDYKKEVYERVKHMIGEGSSYLHLMMSKDEDLYNSVRIRFDAHGDTWETISWLKK